MPFGRIRKNKTKTKTETEKKAKIITGMTMGVEPCTQLFLGKMRMGVEPCTVFVHRCVRGYQKLKRKEEQAKKGCLDWFSGHLRPYRTISGCIDR